MSDNEGGNAYGEKIYFWVDSVGVRCSPRHRTLKAAIAFFKDQESRWVRGDDGRPQNVPYDRDQFPSQEKPDSLRVGEYVERPLSVDEQAKLDTIRELMQGGYV
jgi:hypothetical protein